MTSPVRAVVTDIEGTTSSISFVHEVLFPYARRALPAFVRSHRDDPEVRPWLEQVAHEIGADGAGSAEVAEALIAWIDADRKHTALKALQGVIWRAGYEQGEFVAHVYPEVPGQLSAWKRAGLRLYVYSSGSVPAQKLLFGHTQAGDLTGLFDGWFDTSVGGKRETTSYRRIAGEIGLEPDAIVFLSDLVAELDAAREAGLRTVLLERSGPLPDRNGHPVVNDFCTIELPP